MLKAKIPFLNIQFDMSWVGWVIGRDRNLHAGLKPASSFLPLKQMICLKRMIGDHQTRPTRKPSDK
jgi:hypothetical protein